MNGYVLLSISDVNECLPDGGRMACPDVGARCENNQGSFDCRCIPGYTRINNSCVGKLTTKNGNWFFKQVTSSEFGLHKLSAKAMVCGCVVH